MLSKASIEVIISEILWPLSRVIVYVPLSPWLDSAKALMLKLRKYLPSSFGYVIYGLSELISKVAMSSPDEYWIVNDSNGASA